MTLQVIKSELQDTIANLYLVILRKKSQLQDANSQLRDKVRIVRSRNYHFFIQWWKQASILNSMPQLECIYCVKHKYSAL